jgi:hypothetical protein
LYSFPKATQASFEKFILRPSVKNFPFFCDCSICPNSVKLLLIILLLCLQLQLPLATLAQAPTEGETLPAPSTGQLRSAGHEVNSTVGAPILQGTAQIEELNRQILLTEILLEKHALNFRRLNNFQGRWKGWRYFLTQEANNDTTAAGLIIQLDERYRIVKHPYTLSTTKVTTTSKKGIKTTETKIVAVVQKPRRSVEEAGFYPQLAGQFLAMAGSGLEMSLNHYHQWRANKAGYACRDSIKQVRAYRDQIDNLFSQRRAIIDSGILSAKEILVARAEAAVLHDTTALSLDGYVDAHTNARRFRTLQDALYVFDIARNGTGAAGNIVGIVGQHEGSAYLGGPTNVMTTVSGAIGVITPLASRAWGKFVADRHQVFIRRGIGKYTPCQLADYDLDRKHLQILVDAKNSRGEIVSEKAAALLASYEAAAAERSAQLHLAERDLRAGTRAAQENITVGCTNGITKVVIGVTGVIAGYGLTTANHRANDIIIPGTITYIAGTFLSAGDNIRLRFVDEVNRYKLGSLGLLPGQVLNTRMKALDALEQNLQALK